MHTIYPATTFSSSIAYPSTPYPAPQYTTGTAQEQIDGWSNFTSNVILHLPDWSNGSGRPGIIACHGRQNNALSAFGADYGSNWGDYLISLVNAGFVVVACDLGENSWSNNMTLRILDQAYTYLTGITGRSTVGLMGSSAGTNAALQWHRRHPDLVSGTFLISAFTDLDMIHGTGGYTVPFSVQPGDPNAALYPTNPNPTYPLRSSLDGAYKSSAGDAAWSANSILQGHTPSRYPEQWTNRYLHFQHAVMDSIVPYQGTVWFVNQVNDPKCTIRLVTASTANHIANTHLAGGANDAATLAAGGAARSELRDFFYEVFG